MWLLEISKGGSCDPDELFPSFRAGEEGFEGFGEALEDEVSFVILDFSCPAISIVWGRSADEGLSNSPIMVPAFLKSSSKGSSG